MAEQQTPLIRFVGDRPVIEIGRLRHTITIQKLGPGSPVTVNDGGVVQGWNTFTTAKAGIAAIGGGDVMRGGQVTSQLQLTIVLWWQSGLEANMRVVTEMGNTYVIQSVENVREMNVVALMKCVALGDNS